MAYKCICGTYVFKFLELCRQCRGEHGYYSDWPEWVRWDYFDLNLGGDYEYGELDELGRPGSVKAAPLGKPGDILKEVTDPQLGERAGRKCPICHTKIKANERLCRDHLADYGRDQDKWPQWLLALATDDQKQIDAARNHREGSIDDETFTRRQGPGRPQKAGGKIPGSYGGRTIAYTNQDEISTEAINWGDDDLEGSGDSTPEPGAIAGDRNGHKYNAAAWRGGNDQYKEFGAFSERDYIENKIAAEQDLNLWNPQAAAVLLLSENGYSQKEIAGLMKIRQQKVSEILRKAVKRG